MEKPPKPAPGLTKLVGSDLLEIVPLGGGNEVGRSCIMVKFRGKLIMVAAAHQLDCGIHPASNDISALPFFDLIDPAEVDLVLVTQYASFPASPFLTPASTSTTAERSPTSPSAPTSRRPST